MGSCRRITHKPSYTLGAREALHRRGSLWSSWPALNPQGAGRGQQGRRRPVKEAWELVKANHVLTVYIAIIVTIVLALAIRDLVR